MKRSFRKIGWDYSRKADYMVTITAKNNQHVFGRLNDGVMSLSKEGHAAYFGWMDLPSIHPHVELGVFIIMPNQVLGIVHIRNNDYNGAAQPEGNTNQKHNLSHVIRGYKKRISRQIREFNPSFSWESRHQDRILFNDAQYNAATKFLMGAMQEGNQTNSN